VVKKVIKPAEQDCIQRVGEVVGNTKSVWKNYFQNGKEIVFKNDTAICTFEVLLYIMGELKVGTPTIPFIKDRLVKEYKSLAQYLPALLKIWVHDKKITKSRQMNIQQVEEFIQNENYFITDIDVWIIAETLKLPIILFCAVGLKFLKLVSQEKKPWILFSKYEENSLYYFIRAPSEDNVNLSIQPRYQLIVPRFKADSDFLFKDPMIPEQNTSLKEFLRQIS
jgi:hypothetical protein